MVKPVEIVIQGKDQASGALNSAGESASKMGDSVAEASAKADSALGKVQGAAKGVGAGAAAAADGMKQFDGATKNAGVEVEKSTGIIGRMGQAWKSTVAQFALGNLVSDLFTTIANKLSEMGREFVRANVEMDGMRRALTAIYKDGALAESQIAFLRKTANDAGVSYSSLTDSFKSFTASATAANIPLQVQNELFSSVAQAGATLGLSGERVSQAMLALSQMASKGVVSMEELRGQLGESLPGALSLVSKGLGLAEADLIKLVESGGLAARDLFPALAQSLKTMSGENVGAAASWERLKSAITQVFTAAGDSGGMTLLNGGIKLLAVLLGTVLVPLTALISGLFSFGQMALATGSIIAILADRTTTWAQKKQAMRTEVDALTEALRANAERVEGVNSAFAQAVGSTDEATAATGRATAAAGNSAQAAAALSSAWVATGFAMREAEANAARLAANAEKNAQAAKSEGEALVALAKIRGDANALADAEAQAAQRNSQALAAVAAERAKALEIAQAELTAKTNLIAGNAEEQKAREKDIKDLGEKVEKLRAEANASQEAANAARNGALASQAAAEARSDHASQIKELTKELERAKGALQDVERLALNDKKTTEDVRDAKERLTLAQARLNDAYADNVAKQQANVAAAQNDAQTTRLLLQAQLEVARVEEQRARQRGDEYGARQALIKQKEIEIAIMAAEVDASKLVAMAKIAETNAVREQLIASGQLTEAKKVELDATTRAAEAQIKLAEARGAGVKLQQEALEKIKQGTSGLDDFTRAAGQAGDAGQKAARGIATSWGAATTAINASSQALQEYQRRMQQTYGRPGEGDKGLFERGRMSSNGQELAPGVQEVGTGGSQYRNKDGWSSDATGKAISQGIWTRTAIIDYLSQSGLDEKIAIKLSEQFVDANGNVPYAAGDVQKRWAGKYGTLSEALGKMAEYYKYSDQGQMDAAQMLDYEKKRLSPSPNTTQSATYVSNITIDGTPTTVRFADADSQAKGEDLLRRLARAKGTTAR